jgi:hypothetical protein
VSDDDLTVYDLAERVASGREQSRAAYKEIAAELLRVQSAQVDPQAIYEAILRSITQVRDVTLQRVNATRVAADDAMLDEMARNSAQVIIGMLDDPRVVGDHGRRSC